MNKENKNVEAAQKKELDKSSSHIIEYSNAPVMSNRILDYKFDFVNVETIKLFTELYNNKSDDRFIIQQNLTAVNRLRLKNYLLKSSFINIKDNSKIKIFNKVEFTKKEIHYKFNNEFLELTKPHKNESYLRLDLNFIRNADFSNLTDFMSYVLSQSIMFKKNKTHRFTTKYLSEFLFINKKITKKECEFFKYFTTTISKNNVVKIYFSDYKINKRKLSSVKISFDVKLKKEYRKIDRNNTELIEKSTKRFMKNISESEKELDKNKNHKLTILFNSLVNLKISGKGGTGKTFLTQDHYKNKRGVQVVTPTNEAAQLWAEKGFKKARTLHSFFLLGTSHLTWRQMYKRLSRTRDGRAKIKELRARLVTLKTLIIDEDSMVSQAQLEYIVDCIIHLCGEEKLNKMNFICIGDSSQLQPVAPIEQAGDYEKESSHIYTTSVYEALKFVTYELTEKKRTIDENLEKLQEDTFNATNYKEVISAIEDSGKKIETYIGPYSKDTVVIAGKNATVDLYNQEVQSKNPNPEITFGYDLSSEELEYLKEREIPHKESYKQTFKEGDKVFFYQKPKNSSYKVFDKKTKEPISYSVPSPYNGLEGEIIELDSKFILIETKYYIYKLTKKEKIYIQDKKGNKTKIYYESFPIKLGYAMTCHKTQGKTISENNNIAIFLYDFFEYNSFEVAIGRGRKLSQYKFIDHTNLYKRNGFVDYKPNKDDYMNGLIVSDEAKELLQKQKKQSYKVKSLMNRVIKESLVSKKEETKVESKSKTRLKSLQEMNREEKLAIVNWLDSFKNEYDTISILASNSTSSSSLIDGDGFGLLMNTFIMYRLYDEKGPHTGKLRHLYKRDQKFGIDRTRELENLEYFTEDIVKPLKRRIADNVDLFFLLLTIHSIANQAGIRTDNAFYDLVNSTYGKHIRYYENKEIRLFGEDVVVDEYYSFFKYGEEVYYKFDLDYKEIQKKIFWKKTWYEGYELDENEEGLRTRSLIYDVQINEFFNEEGENSAVLYAEELIGKEADEFTDDDWVMLIDDGFSNLEF